MASAGSAESATHQSVERAMAVLSCFDEHEPELTVSEMARRLGVHRSTASRLAATLAQGGFLTRQGDRYLLGVEVMRLGAVALRGLDLVTQLRPTMDRLGELTRETINLAVPDGDAVLNVAEIESTYIVGALGGWVGRRTEPHPVANGKVLLAWGAVPLKRPLRRFTEHTITDPAALQAELGRIRSRGYATTVEELQEGVVAVAAPVFGAAGDCIAAISVTGPPFRLTPERVTELGKLVAHA